MYGTLQGNILGVFYFLAFQVLGILLAFRLLQKEKCGFALLFGSTLGSFALQWFPLLPSFLLGFSKKSHAIGLLLFAIVYFLVLTKIPKEKTQMQSQKFSLRHLLVEHPVVFLLLPLYIYMIVVLNGHTIPQLSNGSIHTGQCTFGDMNMHLGFITSIANQGTFPPEYSILPGTKLAYPFLSDSISSSIYIWGASLRLSYLLPMYAAMLQVLCGMYTLSILLLKKKGKAFLAFIFFFLNGGFGFLYFINKGLFDENFTRIFTAFYETPTNLIGENIRWTNVIVDMLIPQRATLFGFAVLFPLLCLVIKAKSSTENKSYFILAGVVAGGLPMIHTHSFMGLGLLCFGWLLLELIPNRRAMKTSSDRPSYLVRILIIGGTLIGLTVISYMKRSNATIFSNSLIFGIGIFIIIALIILFGWFLYKGWKKELLPTWGIFLLIVMILALPQLFFWTFKQASGEQFVRGNFNWSNETNLYVMFYLKNIGITFILLIAGLLFGKREKRQLVIPALIIWAIAEFIVFQPNLYDNNKLLLIAYAFICIFTADFAMDILEKLKITWLRNTVLTCLVFLAGISALLTMGREAVSDYELYSKDYVKVAEFIEEETEPTDTFLTATNHNNAIASLTGRNIVCGTGSFLFYHGLNYRQVETDVQIMYQDASARESLLEKYNVDYIVVGSSEIYNYSISDISSFTENYELVFRSGGVLVFRV